MNALGERYEALACTHLQSGGLILLTRNFSTRFGEIDLVMRDKNVLVFVEVRYRAGRRFGGGVESVTAAKRARLVTAAEQYRQAHPALSSLPCRFDVVALGGDADAPHIDWLRNAFES